MLVTTEITINNIYDELWSGGRDTLDDLTDEQIETVLDTLETSVAPDFSITDLNDFFWFERDTIAEWLGYEDYDALVNGDIVKKLDNGHYFKTLEHAAKNHTPITKPLKCTWFYYDADSEQFI